MREPRAAFTKWDIFYYVYGILHGSKGEARIALLGKFATANPLWRTSTGTRLLME